MTNDVAQIQEHVAESLAFLEQQQAKLAEERQQIATMIEKSRQTLAAARATIAVAEQILARVPFVSGMCATQNDTR